MMDSTRVSSLTFNSSLAFFVAHSYFSISFGASFSSFTILSTAVSGLGSAVTAVAAAGTSTLEASDRPF